MPRRAASAPRWARPGLHRSPRARRPRRRRRRPRAGDPAGRATAPGCSRCLDGRGARLVVARPAGCAAAAMACGCAGRCAGPCPASRSRSTRPSAGSWPAAPTRARSHGWIRPDIADATRGCTGSGWAHSVEAWTPTAAWPAACTGYRSAGSSRGSRCSTGRRRVEGRARRARRPARRRRAAAGCSTCSGHAAPEVPRRRGRAETGLPRPLPRPLACAAAAAGRLAGGPGRWPAEPDQVAQA